MHATTPPPTDTLGNGVDATRCPLCGGSNRCAMEIARETGSAPLPCWCMRATFSDSLTSRVPDTLRGRACICASCAATAAAKTGSTDQDCAWVC